MAVIPAITPLYCAKELAATSALPIVSLVDPLNRELAAREARRVAIFGTRFVIESDLFGALRGVEVVRPGAEEVDLIHKTYVELAATGEASPQKYEKLTALAYHLVSRHAVDAILLAGTDLTLLHRFPSRGLCGAAYKGDFAGSDNVARGGPLKPGFGLSGDIRCGLTTVGLQAMEKLRSVPPTLSHPLQE